MIASGRALYLAAFCAAATPAQAITVSQWAAENRVVAAEASPQPGPWRNELAPYLVEIMDCLSPEHPARDVAMAKSAQVAGSEGGINFVGCIVDRYPGPTMIVLPTVDLSKSYVAQKLQPAIDATPVLRAKITEQKSRDGGSTTRWKRFPGGFITITGANSSAGLQMLSIRFLVKEELAEWPDDVDGRGDPERLADKRTTAFTGSEKKFSVSTPGLKGSCRITAKFLAGDQRRYQVPCPHCAELQTLKWAQLKHNAEPPFEAHYACEHCGVLIAHHHKRAMLAAGRWVAEAPGEGRSPSFHLNQLYSPFVSWDETAAEFVSSRGDATAEKVFTQQVLGEPWEEKGDAPEAQVLLLRREPYQLGRIPPGGLFVTRGVDVGATYLAYETVAWGVGKASWSIDFGFLPGNTDHDDVWADLAKLLDRQYQDAWGRLWPCVMTAIDSGYNSHAVYDFCRRQGRGSVMAIKGVAGYDRASIGTPSKVDVSWRGQRVKGGAFLWPIGVYHFKSQLYAALRKRGPRDGLDAFEAGYAHFSLDHDERFFAQLTAEELMTREGRGRTTREWVAKGPNHYHDARIYASAAAERMGISRLTDQEWAGLVAERGTAPAAAQLDLLAAASLASEGTSLAPAAAPAPALASVEPAAVPPSVKPAAPAPAPRAGWIPARKNWLGGR